MEIKIQGLHKQYGRGARALHGIDLTLRNGMFGLLGPNGAGKTTLMKILATLLEPTGGRVAYDGLLWGQDNQLIRARLGYLCEVLRAIGVGDVRRLQQVIDTRLDFIHGAIGTGDCPVESVRLHLEIEQGLAVICYQSTFK